jgi:hypothetical protein
MKQIILFRPTNTRVIDSGNIFFSVNLDKTQHRWLVTIVGKAIIILWSADRVK